MRGGRDFYWAFRMGSMRFFFQMEGTQLLVNEKLKISVMVIILWGPRCFRCIVETRSGPAALELLRKERVVLISSGEMGER